MQTDADSPGLPALLTAEELAEWLGVTTRTLRRWRTQGVGPSAVSVERLVRYTLDAVLAWLLQQPAEMADAAGTATETHRRPNAARDGHPHALAAAGPSRHPRPAEMAETPAPDLVTAGASR